MSVDTDKLADATDPILPIVSAPRHRPFRRRLRPRGYLHLWRNLR